MQPSLAFICIHEGGCNKRPRSTERRLTEHFRAHFPKEASRREVSAAGKAARAKFASLVGPAIDDKVLARRVVWPGSEDRVREEWGGRKRRATDEGSVPAKVAREEVSAAPVPDDGWEVWLKVGEKCENLNRQAQNQVLAGMARVKTTLALNVTDMVTKFEVDRREDKWGRWATSRGLEAIRTHFNQTRDELDHAARRIIGYEKQLGGVNRPRVPSRALVKVGDLERAKQDAEALQASRATTQKRDGELQEARAQVMSLEAQLRACRSELRAERVKKGHESGRGKDNRVTSAVTSQVTPPSTVRVAVTPILDTPTMAGVFRGIDPVREDAMVVGDTSPKDIVAARLALLQVWQCMGEYHHQ
jgi:hypothetical protein